MRRVSRWYDRQGPLIFVDYIEGIGADDPYGAIFYRSDGLIQWGSTKPGPASSGYVVATPDVRIARQVLVDAAVDGRRVIDVESEPVPEEYAKAALASGITQNPILTMPGEKALELFDRRRRRAMHVVGDMTEVELASSCDRTAAKLVLLECERRGFLWEGQLTKPKFNLGTSKTGRFGCVGFNVMSIKKDTRSKLEARPGHALVSFDFKSIDGRSVVALSEEGRVRYGSEPDVYGAIFADVYDRPADDESRAQFKLDFFQYAYGPCSKFKSDHIGYLNGALPWVEELREKLYDPNVHDHIGQGLAWEAQRMSSRAFNAGLRNSLSILCCSKELHPLFTVHDELLIELDMDHPDSIWPLRDKLEEGASEATGVKHVVKLKTGRTYAEC